MPQIIINHATNADVIIDPDDASKRIVKLNVNEEDFFQVLDTVNPKNIVKYLDMRGIPHREALQINVKPIDVNTLPERHTPEYGRAIKRLRCLEERNNKKMERIKQLIEPYKKKIT